jgi:long-chain acyl-CoA synthetase
MKNIPLNPVRPIADLKQMLAGSAAEFGARPAFLRKDHPDAPYTPVSFRQLLADVGALGTALLDLGLAGRRVAVVGENQYAWAVTYLAVANGVGVIVPVDRELPEGEIRRCLERAEAEAVVFAESKREVMASIAREPGSVRHFIDMRLGADAAGALSFERLLERGRALLQAGRRDYLHRVIDPEAMSVLLFTSGTTSESKAVPLSHRNLCADMVATVAYISIGPGDVFLSILPIHHTYECMCGFLGPLYCGATIAFCDGLRHIPRNLRESKCTFLVAVPLVLETMYKRIWSEAERNGRAGRLRKALAASNALRRVGIDLRRRLFTPIFEALGPDLGAFVCGAAALAPHVSKGFRDFGIVVLQGYGLTECSPILACNRERDWKDDAAGLPIPGLDLRIREPNAEGVGEIVAKGPMVMAGYYRQPEETAKAFTPDGYFRTGDLGFVDADGFLHITGRAKNVIVAKNGRNVYPEEIESLIGGSPYVLECMVYGRMEEGGSDIELAVAIVPALEAIAAMHAPDGLSPDEIRGRLEAVVRDVNRRLPAFKRIRHVIVRETEFAKTTTRKIKRYLEKQHLGP